MTPLITPPGRLSPLLPRVRLRGGRQAGVRVPDQEEEGGGGGGGGEGGCGGDCQKLVGTKYILVNP